MLKTRLNVLTLRKEPLPTVIFHEPEAIELCSTTPLAKGRSHAGYKVGHMTSTGPRGTNQSLNTTISLLSSPQRLNHSIKHQRERVCVCV